jgi:hypothetical protein
MWWLCEAELQLSTIWVTILCYMGGGVLSARGMQPYRTRYKSSLSKHALLTSHGHIVQTGLVLLIDYNSCTRPACMQSTHTMHVN